MKEKLTIEKLIKEARAFCMKESEFQNKDLFGVTDGKAVGTYIEHKFQEMLGRKYEYSIGSSARGIDFPGEEINTDLKVTSIVQPQSSCPFKNAKQKIYGLGYLIIPNTLQWRLQYQRKVDLAGDVEGIVKIVDEDRLEQNHGKYLI